MIPITYVSPPVPSDLTTEVVQWHGYRQTAPMPMRHWALPDPIVPLVFGFGGVHELESITERIEAASFCGGLTETAVSVVAPTYHGLQVDLTPFGAARVVGVPAHELAGRLYDVRDLFGSAGPSIAERLEIAPNWPERFRLTAAFLRSRLQQTDPVASDVEHAWSVMRATNGRVSVRALAVEVGWSERRVRAHFASYVGVSPKRAVRLFRIRHASDLLTSRPDLSLAAVAVHTGFSDQAHLSNEIKRMAGLTATELRSHGPGGVFEH